MNRFGNIDSKFRFVILASKRAKQLLKGAKSKVKTKSRNPIRVAQSEVRSGAVEYEILPTQKEDFKEQEDRVFVGEGLHDETIEVEDTNVGKRGASRKGKPEEGLGDREEDNSDKDVEEDDNDDLEEEDEEEEGEEG